MAYADEMTAANIRAGYGSGFASSPLTADDYDDDDYEDEVAELGERADEDELDSLSVSSDGASRPPSRAASSRPPSQPT